jgi:hypothetical protein
MMHGQQNIKSIILVLFMLNKAEGGGKWSTTCLGRFAPGKELHYPLNESLDAHQNQSGWFWMRGNRLPLLGFEPWTI